MATSNQTDFESQCVFSLQMYLHRICIRSWTVYLDSIKSPDRERYSPLNLSKLDRDCHWAHSFDEREHCKAQLSFPAFNCSNKNSFLHCLDIMIQTPSWGSRAQTIRFFFIWCKHSFLILLKHFKWKSHLFSPPAWKMRLCLRNRPRQQSLHTQYAAD